VAESLPDRAEIVVIGGGIVGCSVAYHLTKLGRKDVLLLERKRLSCGTTWHAAGLVGQLRATHNLTTLAKYGGDLYERLEAETGQATGFRRSGSLAVARTAERWTELLRGASMGRCFGVDCEPISVAEAGRRWPLMETEGLVGALWIPGDGQTNPTDTTMALAKGARKGGARVVEGVNVSGIRIEKGAVAAVETDRGAVACESVVNCGGMWGREIGAMAGVAVPLHAAEHFYVVTTPIEGVAAGLPTLRDPDGRIYIKEDAGKLLMGGFEKTAKPWGMDGIPKSFEFDTLPEDWDQFEGLMTAAIERVPAFATAGIRQMLVGPESFTPDNRYMLGEAPEVRRFYVAAGFNSVGIGAAAGAGKAIADWIVADGPTMDLWDVDIRRYHPAQADAEYLRDRTVEVLGLLYDMHWPYRQPESARGLRRSPLHDRHAAANACFGELAGWERPNWYAAPGTVPAYEYSFGRQNWFDRSAAEHRAVREAAGLFDMSSFGKIAVAGADAEAALQRLAANDVGGPPGRVVYTAMLNERGGIEADLTVTRLAEDRYLVVTAAATVRRDLDWMRRHTEPTLRVEMTDETAEWASLAVMGPRARDVLAPLADTDLSDAAFPFAAAREIGLAGTRVLAQRITYVGELGWELHLAAKDAGQLYDALMESGAEFGLRPAGFHALDSLRLECAYRSWGHDIGLEDTPYEAGLGFAVRLEKPAPFIGREVLLASRDETPARRLAQFTLDDAEPLLFHDEPIWRDGVLVGRVTSGAYGHALGRAVGLGWVGGPDGGPAEDAYLAEGRYEIEIAGERTPATFHPRPAYDPGRSRVKG